MCPFAEMDEGQKANISLVSHFLPYQIDVMSIQQMKKKIRPRKAWGPFPTDRCQKQDA